MQRKLSYLGPPNTYSEIAAREFSGRLNENMEILPYASAASVARSLVLPGKDKIDYAVMPYYNFLDGLVQECLDLIYEYRLCIFDSRRIQIELALGMHPDGSAGDSVYSHAKGLAQCSGFLRKNHPNIFQIPVSSTAEAAKMVGNKKVGLAIASKKALEHYGLEIKAEYIGNQRHGKVNFTDFYLLSKHDQNTYSSDQRYLTMITVTPRVDRQGLLAEILGQVAYYGLNNAKIHSRPAIDDVSLDVEPQMFYLEIMTHKDNPDFKKCIDALEYRLTPKESNAEVVRVLGSYPRPGLNKN